MFASANRAAAGVLSEFLRENRTEKAIVACFSAPHGIWDLEIKALEQGGIPNYPTPERAARSLTNLLRYRKLMEKGE